MLAVEHSGDGQHRHPRQARPRYVCVWPRATGDLVKRKVTEPVPRGTGFDQDNVGFSALPQGWVRAADAAAAARRRPR